MTKRTRRASEYMAFAETDTDGGDILYDLVAKGPSVETCQKIIDESGKGAGVEHIFVRHHLTATPVQGGFQWGAKRQRGKKVEAKPVAESDSAPVSLPECTFGPKCVDKNLNGKCTSAKACEYQAEKRRPLSDEEKQMVLIARENADGENRR